MMRKDGAKPQENEYYTVDEYLSFERASEVKHEYISGLIIAMAGASRAHNLITGNVSQRLRNALEGKPCETYSSDMRVRTTPSEYTYPDVVVACGEPEFEDKELDTLLTPTVVVEVLSGSTERRDRFEKFGAYRAIPSLRELLLISQDKLHIEHHVKGPHNEWILHDVDERGETIRLESIGAELRISDVYERVTFPPQRQLRRVDTEDETER
jgi:Uma2 family endonuclease